MIGTMMIMQLYSFAVAYNELSKTSINWAEAKVFIKYEAGGNITAGGEAHDNFYVPLMEIVSKHKARGDRIFIAPFLEDRASLGKATMTAADFMYYKSSWGAIFAAPQLAKGMFPHAPDIAPLRRKPIPGDYDYDPTGKLKHFITRLRYSLIRPEESITNCLGFWLVGELANKKFKYPKMNLPGLTSGFPKGIKAYPPRPAEEASE
jgi:hypothetical protein